MTGDLGLAVTAFFGGATPWLEAILVVPVAIVAGLHPVVAVVAGASGNLLTVAVAAWSGERIVRWWRRRRGREVDADVQSETGERGGRARRVLERWGLPALAVLGPLGLGTQLSALVAVSFGIAPERAFRWIGAATVCWSVVAAALAVVGTELFS